MKKRKNNINGKNADYFKMIMSKMPIIDANKRSLISIIVVLRIIYKYQLIRED